jgi:hypothetical protein
VVKGENIDTNSPGGETRALSNPLVQAELSRQQRDLEELAASPSNPEKTITTIEQRARAESHIFFGTAETI